MSAADARVVVLGYGNLSRGDDAAGPLLLARLAAEFPAIEAVEDFQLQIEHALDLREADLVLFLDAGTGTPAPFAFYEAKPRAAFTASTHALHPEAVLAVFAQVEGRPPPPAFVLCVRGEDFELGAPMSAAAGLHLVAAEAFARELMREPRADAWRARVTCSGL